MNIENVLLRYNEIMNNLNTASLEDISCLLEYYAIDKEIIGKTSFPPFTDEKAASKLNSRFRELTGFSHPKYVKKRNKDIQDFINATLEQPDLSTKFSDTKPGTESDNLIPRELTYIKPNPGTSIYEFARKIVGKPLIGTFNDFVINGTKYSSSDDIVNAYQSHVDQKRKEIEETSLSHGK